MPADQKLWPPFAIFRLLQNCLSIALRGQKKKTGDRVTLIGEKKEDPDQSVQPQFHHGVHGTAYVAHVVKKSKMNKKLKKSSNPAFSLN